MKCIFSILLIVFCSGALEAQDLAKGKEYPYRIVSSPEKFPVGNYIFKDDFDYIYYMSRDYTKPLAPSAFFYPNESGVILSREFTSGSYGFGIDRVEETDNEVIVYAKVTTPKGIRTCDMSYRTLFIAIKKTIKKIVIMEITE